MERNAHISEPARTILNDWIKAQDRARITAPAAPLAVRRLRPVPCCCPSYKFPHRLDSGKCRVRHSQFDADELRESEDRRSDALARARLV